MINEYYVLIALQPDGKEWLSHEDFSRWLFYAETLDELGYILDNGDSDALVSHINHVMGTKLSSNPQHEACTDVATTLENLIPALYAGKFNY